ncbi:transcriptional regulator, TetR family [Geodermatophilus pulveris]|uniref:Transcriptional regulator, TetR family n=1 Tax=Geodermatophilus pulveris TaxID=1564159 RepID=A0A239FIM6_9ACTN|nr:TetR/AcrR family transcriptional regulator [Geodermatophilus pulveris]SNS55914.1 transcriptional regulator, TetR family [Geodermatophilus pulveris]
MTGRKQFAVDDALDAAVRVFWERGYDGATVAHLLEGTGLGRGSLYATFGDKEELFLACLDRYATTVAARLLAALRSHPGDPRAAVGAMYTAILARMQDPGCPSGCLVTLSAGECATLPQRAREVVQQLIAGQVREVRGVLAEGASCGVVPHGGDPDALAEYLVGTAQTLALLHRAGTDVPTLRGIADTALHVLHPEVP